MQSINQLLTSNRLPKVKFFTPLLLLSELLVGLVIGFGLLAFLYHFKTEIWAGPLAEWDEQISYFFYELRQPWLSVIMYIFSLLGQEVMVVIVGILAAVLLIRNHKREAMLFVVIPALGSSLNTVLKYVIQRPRPVFSPLLEVNHSSFPSGHATGAMVFYGLVIYFSFYFIRQKVSATLISITAAIMIVMVGVSRIYLGVHYPSDIVGGYLVGLWWLLTVMLAHRSYNRLRQLRHSYRKPEDLEKTD